LPKPAEIDRAEDVRSARASDLHLFRYRKRIVHLDAEIPDRAFNFGVAEHELDGSQIAGSPVDQRRLCPTQRMRAKQFRIKSDACHPFREKPTILAGRHALAATLSAREQELTGILSRNSEVVVNGLPSLIRLHSIALRSYVRFQGVEGCLWSRAPCKVGLWPIASFRCRAAIASVLE